MKLLIQVSADTAWNYDLVIHSSETVKAGWNNTANTKEGTNG